MGRKVKQTEKSESQIVNSSNGLMTDAGNHRLRCWEVTRAEQTVRDPSR